MHKQTYIVVDKRQRYAVAQVWDNAEGVQQMEVCEGLFARNMQQALAECEDLGIALTHKYSLPLQ